MIKDSNNQPVESIIMEADGVETKTVLLFAFVEDFTSEYYFLINGEKVSVSSE